MADLGAHGIDHFLAGDYMASKSRVSHFILGSTTFKPVKRIWCSPLGISEMSLEHPYLGLELHAFN